MVLTVNKTTFKLGEVPELDVRITNNTDDSIYMIGPLTTDTKRRMPQCYYEIAAKPDTIFFSDGGFANHYVWKTLK